MGRTNKAAYIKHGWSGGKRKQRQVQAALLHHYGTKSRIVAWRSNKTLIPEIPEPSNDQTVINNGSTSADTRNKKRDATSSTTVDTRRRLQDPTPTHLKYGTFRRLSKLRQSQEDPLLSPRCESRPIVVARSSVTEKRSPSPKDPLKIERSSITPPTDTAPLQHSPLRRPTRRVYLSRTEPIHLDIKPKSFPSMLWC
ncbi:uncharacterized protein LOC134753338 isoform X3 [Cydia strobilella]|uniref:uncharacterized protein LOC134753338 isoform X3 n=1 Tax=Cydia strobilella TaxID=1100964 RepID=UPI003007EC9E